MSQTFQVPSLETKYPGIKIPRWAKEMHERAETFYYETHQYSSRMDSLQSDIDEAKATSEEAKTLAAEARDSADELNDRTLQLELEIKNLCDKIRQMEDYSRRSNLKIDGIPELDVNEIALTDVKLETEIRKMFSENMNILNPGRIAIDKFHRLGKLNESAKRPRTVLVRFKSLTDRDTVWAKRTSLRGSKLFLKEDFCKDTEDQRRQLLPYLRSSVMLGAKSTLKTNKIIVNSTTYNIDNLHTFPKILDPMTAATREQDDKLLFFTKESVFSNFHPAPFKMGLENYDHSEQYYQCKKAEHFQKDDIAHKIRSESDPLRCKKLGDSIRCDWQKWQQEAPEVMYKGVFEKFKQNPSMKDILLNTGTKTLAEGSRDRFWGTGIPIHYKNAFQGWTGNNNLGNILMRVRNDLRNKGG